MQTEQPESYIDEPKTGDLNDGWVGDGIRESLVILFGVKIYLWLRFIKNGAYFSQHNTAMHYRGSEAEREGCQGWGCWSGQKQEGGHASQPHYFLRSVMLQTSPKEGESHLGGEQCIKTAFKKAKL